MFPVLGSSQGQAACEGSGAGSRDGPKWDVLSPTWSPKHQREGQMVVGSMGSPKHSSTNEPGQAECGCGFQVRKLRARKEF